VEAADEQAVDTLTLSLGTVDGVRLLSHRPSVLFKVERYATEPPAGDIAVEGLRIAGPGWDERLRDLLAALSPNERASLFAVRIHDRHGLPMPAKTVLDRARTDWFPKFLSLGQLTPVFQPIYDLRGGRVYGREALVRGRMGKSEVRGSELLEAAEVHDAIYSFDTRARAIALEVGLPRLPENEVLFVNLDPRGVVDVESSLKSVWPAVERAGATGTSVGLELTHVERATEIDVLEQLVRAHRARGAVIAVDHLSAGGESLRVLEALKPDLAKLDISLCKGIELSSGRRKLVSALVEVAHELSCRVVATGIERDSELESVRDVGVDFVQGFFVGQPNEEMLPVDERILDQRPSGVRTESGIHTIR